MGRMFLLVIDAHSKWLEVYPTTVATSAATIALLRKSFATFGLPEVVVSDNGSNEEFETFMKKNGVKHVKTPPYHPASNGLVERAVQTFKSGMKKLSEGSVETKVSRFLFKYRLTPQTSTGVSPPELMFSRRLRSPLDNIRPSLERKTNCNQERQRKAHDSHARNREFGLGDRVYVKNYGSGNPWLPGEVTSKLGSTMYVVCLDDGRSVRKHADQMRSRIEEVQADGSVELNSDIGNSFEMRVPRETEQSDSNDNVTVESSSGEPASTSTTADSTDSTNQEPDIETPSNEEPSLPQLRRSNRLRNQTDFYGVVPI